MIDLLPLSGAGIYATDNNTHGMNITNNTVNGTRDVFNRKNRQHRKYGHKLLYYWE